VFITDDGESWQGYGLLKDCLQEFIREDTLERVVAIVSH
jgi:hypothetical protein